ncbi:small ribosomal subunit protein mS23 [Pelodytes ibericus]
MAGSRLEKLGTVFTRVRDLLRAGVIKPKEKPIWFDVYAAFPPKREPLYEKPPTRRRQIQDNVPSIFYQEDLIRAKFYEAYGNGPRIFDLSQKNFKSTCQRFVDKYTELQKVESDEEKLFEEAGKALLSEGVILRRKGVSAVQHQQSSDAADDNALNNVNIKDVLEEIQQEPMSSDKTDTQPITS